MSRLSYWHPVLPSAKLPRDRAVGIKLAGCSLALFRTEHGKVGALEDKCVHRHMKLSLGSVDEGKLICPYHGWSYDRHGQGEGPSTPKLRACVASYACAEAHGVIWVKGLLGDQELPKMEMDGWDFVGSVFHKVATPLQLVIDNLSELEHTLTNHAHFGFDRRRPTEAVVEYETTEDWIMVHGHGPAKMPPLATRVMVWIRPGDHFHSDYSFHFDPPRSDVTHFWTNPRTGLERLAKYHVRVYFVPEDEDNTLLVSFAFLKLRGAFMRRFGKYMGWFVRRRICETINEDIFLVENLADKTTSLGSMKLSRFDPVLGMTRERLARVYHGAPSD